MKINHGMISSVVAHGPLEAVLPVEPQTRSHTLRHLALITDGNRRWAKKRGLEPWIGHQKGIAPMKAAIECCLEQRIPYLSFYVFSLENFKRPDEEIEHLFSIIKEKLCSEDDVQKLIAAGVNVRFVGDRSFFPISLCDAIDRVEQQTVNGAKLTVQFLFCYGGQQEITAACRAIACKVAAGIIAPSDVTLQLIEQYMWTNGVPHPDLIVRTSGEKRLSNFLSWQSAYSELLFVDAYWTDITKKDLEKFVRDFVDRQRNFGA